MPAYLTHAIMADEFLKREKQLLKVEIDDKALRTYSLGTDLAIYTKTSIFGTHNTKTKDFFLNMIRYIKTHKKVDDPQAMSLLYGHVCHYFLDTTMHPFCYYLEVGTKKASIISNHTLIEGFWSSYFADYVLKTTVDPSFFNQADLTKVADILKDTYQITYKEKNILESAKRVIKTFTLLEKMKKMLNLELLKQISRFNAFLAKNGYSKETLLNSNSETWFNPTSGFVSKLSCLQLFNLSIVKTSEAIEEINKYLYNNASLNNVKKIFANLSYDTGVNTKYGLKFTYTKKYIL